MNPSDGPLQSFAYELRTLRRSVGNPSYRELARRANYSGTTLSEAARGLSLPSLDVTLAYVRACEGDPDFWQKYWKETEVALRGADSPAHGAHGARAESPRPPAAAPCHAHAHARTGALAARPAPARLRLPLSALAGIAGVAGVAGAAQLVSSRPKATALTVMAGTCIASGFWLGRNLRDA
ncbi:helix-turn-helix domain-containing protein [Streptomyces sp. NPDC001410]|uniref:helix-turn-helix domain-containing protein n=1 Tax=Streptomyces sp. NPDC001410 TaxID=3364574 RepID=UPI00367A9256